MFKSKIMKKKSLLVAIFFIAIVQPLYSQSFDDFKNQYNHEFESFGKERQDGIEALRAEYEQMVGAYKNAMYRMFDSEASSVDIMKTDDNIKNITQAAAPQQVINSAKIADEAQSAKSEIANTSSEQIMRQIVGTTTDKATAEQVKQATEKLSAVVKDVENQTEQPQTEPKSEPQTEIDAKPKTGEKPTPTVTNANIPSGKPCDYRRISSPFGERVHPVYGRRHFHKGVDLAAPNGTPIYATADGVVAFAGTCKGYGKFIKINHQNGYKTGYAHMSRMVVKTNAKVKKGDLIGYVGSTGTSTGNHLHYEVYYQDKLTDPAKTL